MRTGRKPGSRSNPRPPGNTRRAPAAILAAVHWLRSDADNDRAGPAGAGARYRLTGSLPGSDHSVAISLVKGCLDVAGGSRIQGPVRHRSRQLEALATKRRSGCARTQGLSGLTASSMRRASFPCLKSAFTAPTQCRRAPRCRSAKVDGNRAVSRPKAETGAGTQGTHFFRGGVSARYRMRVRTAPPKAKSA